MLFLSVSLTLQFCCLTSFPTAFAFDTVVYIMRLHAFPYLLLYVFSVVFVSFYHITVNKDECINLLTLQQQQSSTPLVTCLGTCRLHYGTLRL